MQGTVQSYVLYMADDRKKEPLKVKQCDTNSRWAKITLKAFDGEYWLIPFDAQIYINVLKTDGTLATATCTKVDEHTVLVPITEQMTAVPGTQLGELYFLGVDGDIKSQTFPVAVYPMVMDQARIESSDDFQSLQEALRDVKVSTEAADNAAQYATEQGNAAGMAAQRAEDAADSIQVAVDAAAAAKACESNARDSELAAAQTQQEVTDYVEAQKAAFVGYSKRESDSKYANAITAMAEGEGGVTVEDAWTAPVLDMEVAGRSEQVVSQLWKPTADMNASYCTYTVDDNQEITIISTGGDSYIGQVVDKGLTNYNEIMRGFFAEISDREKYCLYLTNSDFTINYVTYYDSTKKSLGYTLVSNGEILTPPVGSKYVTIRIGINQGIAGMEYKTKVMFKNIKSRAVWEPYTGGAPSPSPDYPQDIISTGTVSTGAQLLNVDTLEQGGINADTGVIGASSAFVRSDYIPVEPGDYLLSGDGLTPYLNYVMHFDQEKVIQSSSSIKSANGKFTVVDGTAYIRIRFLSKDGVEGTVTPAEIAAFKPMLNAGDTALPWEPYTGGKPAPSVEYPQTLEVTATGANLANITLRNNTGISVVPENGEIKINGTVAEGASNSDIYIVGAYGSKIVRFTGLNTYQVFGLTNDEDIYVINVSLESKSAIGETPITYDSDVTCFMVRLKRGKTYNNMVIRPMVNAGDQLLPWEPYQTKSAPITLTEPLRGVGDYRDRIMCRDGVWGIERYSGKRVLTGNENVYIYTNEALVIDTVTTIVNGAAIGDGRPVKCTHSDFVLLRYRGGRGEGLTGTATVSSTLLWTEAGITPETFKAFLKEQYEAGTPVTILYQLAEPVWEPLPDATQQALNALTTYSGTTHLTITAGGTIPTVTLDYVKDTHKALEQCQEAAREYTDSQIAAIVAALPTATQAAIVDNQTTRLLQEV